MGGIGHPQRPVGVAGHPIGGDLVIPFFLKIILFFKNYFMILFYIYF
jgi:hypothetical protein